MRKFLSLFLVLFTLTFTFTLTCSAETLSDEILAQGKAEADLFLTLKQALGLDWIDEYNAYLSNPATNPVPAWDTSIANLVSQGYLSLSFPTDFTIALTGQEVTISRTVSQAALREAMAIYLPAMTVSGDVVSLLVQRPAQWIAYETALDGKVDKDGSDNPDILPNSSLDFGSNSQINFVSGDGKILGVNSLFYKTQELDNRFVNITGDTMTGILTAAGFKVGSNNVWHQGNDGSGSGLDADLLDGQDSAFYRNASNINAGTLNSARLSGTYGINITGNASTATNANHANNADYATNAGNADTLDGKHESAFAPASHNHGQYVLKAGDTMTGSLIADIDVGPADTRIYKNLASFKQSAASITGTLKITLPKSWSNTMMRIRIVGYNYFQAGLPGAWEVVIGGYNYTGSSSWIAYSAEIRGTAPFSTIRLAHDGSKNCILLGTTSTVWSYPHVVVEEMLAGQASITGWESGWAISVITSESGITKIVTPAIQTMDNYVKKSGDTMTGNLSINHNNNPQIKINAPATGSVSSIELTEQTGYGLRMFYDGKDSGNTAAANVIGGLNNGTFNEVMRFKREGGPVIFSTTPKVGNNVMWHSGNDGSGSGLDADLLDGQGSSFYRNASNLNAGRVPTGRLSDTYNIDISGKAATAGNAEKLDGRDSTQFAYISDTYSATVSSAGWYTIATVSTGRAFGEFYVWDSYSGRHNSVKLIASASYGKNNIAVINGNRYGSRTIAHARILYNTSNRTYGGARLQVYCETPSYTLYVRSTMDKQMGGWTGWNVITPTKENTPSGWAEDTVTRREDITNYNYAFVGDVKGDITGKSSDSDKLGGQLPDFYRNASNLNAGRVPTDRLSGTYNIGISGNAATATNADKLDNKHYSDLQNEFVNVAGDTMTGRLGLSPYGFHVATKDNITTRTDSGFFQTNSATTGEGWPQTTNSWYHLLSSTHSNTGNYYSMQFAGNFYNSNDIYYRSTNGSGTTPWNKMWHSGNDGLNSGLDADLLDGQHGAFYQNASNLNTGVVPTARLSGTYGISITGNAATATTASNSDKLDGYHHDAFVKRAGDTMTGALTAPEYRINDANTKLLEGANNSVRVQTNYGYTEIGPQNASYAHFTTDRPEFYFNKPVEAESKLQVYATNTYLTGTEGKIAGNTVWHAGNDGSGSGSDADLLDGKHWSDIQSYIDANSGSIVAQSLGVNGYVKFDSGLIIQWGKTTLTNSPVYVNFPYVFPHACLSITITMSKNTQAKTIGNDADGHYTSVEYVYAKIYSQSQFQAISYRLGTMPVFWFAIGH